MVEPMPRSPSSPSSSLPHRQPSRGPQRWQLALSGALALTAFQFFGCKSSERPWEAYQWPDTSYERVI